MHSYLFMYIHTYVHRSVCNTNVHHSLISLIQHVIYACFYFTSSLRVRVKFRIIIKLWLVIFMQTFSYSNTESDAHAFMEQFK